MKTYHHLIGFPPGITIPSSLHTRGAFRYSNHAIDQAERKGIDKLPYALPTEYKLIEVSLDHDTIVKVVVRFRYDATNDIVLVVASSGTIITLWLNATNDKHATLDRSKYARP